MPSVRARAQVYWLRTLVFLLTAGASGAAAARGPQSAMASLDLGSWLAGRLGVELVAASLAAERAFSAMLPFAGHDGHADSYHGGGSCSLRLVDLVALAIVAATFVFALRMWHQTQRKRIELAREMLAHGVDPQKELFGRSPGNDLRKGLVSSFAGLGLLAASYLSSPNEVSPAGLIPLFIGLGYLATARIAARSEKDPP